jgi:hypothetical protein
MVWTRGGDPLPSCTHSGVQDPDAQARGVQVNHPLPGAWATAVCCTSIKTGATEARSKESLTSESSSDFGLVSGKVPAAETQVQGRALP